jgi:isopentenyl diphosphate isomerase/L-lactate dehydrogenase-like FMN-dependent dehydrogenase
MSDEYNEKELTLSQVREEARKRLKGICTVNKVCDGQPNRFCMGQSYGKSIGLGGVGKGLSFTANVDALDRIKLKTRLISKHREPDMSCSFFKQKLEIPIMASSLSGVMACMGGSLSESSFAESILLGSKASGTIGWIGNTSDEGQELTGVNAVAKSGYGIPIFKPQKNSRLIELFKIAEDAQAVGVGVDLDGVGSTNWERCNKPVFRKSPDDLVELVHATKLPFIVKGIMSVEDAELAVDAGVKCIDVSNHGGRALDSTRSVADVLPDIRDAVNDKVILTAGGGVRTGFDVLKMLALGADGVLIGRDIIRAVLGGGAIGVRLHFEYLKSELRRGMILTGCNSLNDVDRNILDS